MTKLNKKRYKFLEETFVERILYLVRVINITLVESDGFLFIRWIFSYPALIPKELVQIAL